MSRMTTMAVAAGLLIVAAAAQRPEGVEPTLKVGDKAPRLEIAAWIKGEPINLEDGKGKKVYVVEFWATWCPPCRQTIPHLTKLQEKFKDRGVSIIGISTEQTEKVRTFVEEMGDKMEYTVAVDDAKKTAYAYAKAANAPGIPYAFVIDKEGKVAWHGHPIVPEFEQTLERLAPKKPEPRTRQPRAESGASSSREG